MSALTKIINRANKLRKEHKNMSWLDARKKATAEYHAGKLGAVKMIEKRETKKTKPKHVYRVERKPNGTIKKMSPVGSIASKALTEIRQAHEAIEKAQRDLEKEITLSKMKGIGAQVKGCHRRNAGNLRKYISEKKRHISALKKHL